MTWEFFWFMLPRMLVFFLFMYFAWRIATWNNE